MTYTLQASVRKPGQADTDRGSGNIPGVLYGPDMTPVSFSVAYHTFELLLKQAGSSSLVDVIVDGAAPVKAVVQDVQYDPVSGRITHVDFRQINMKKEMEVPVELVFVSEAGAVKELGGTLIKAVSELRIKCLPKDLVGSLEIDLSPLKTFDDIIRVKDIAAPSGITILDDAETTIAKVAPPLTEEQIKAMEEAGPTSLEDIEVEEKGKKEEEGEGAAEEGADQGEKEEKK